MASLAACIRKAGKNINKEDAAILKEIQQDHIGDGMSNTEAAIKAVNDYTGILKDEKAALSKSFKREGDEDVKQAKEEDKAVLEEDPYAEFYKEALDESGVGQSTKHSEAYERLVGGEPVELHHRSFKKIDSFDDKRKKEGKKGTGTGTAKLGHWLATSDVGDSQRYGDQVATFEVKLDKPFVIDIDDFYQIGDMSNSELAALREALMAQGYDGIVISEIEHVAVFESKSISSKKTASGIMFRPEEEEQINKAPDSPDAVMSKLGASMESQSGTDKKAVVKRIKDVYKNFKTKRIRTLLATIGRRNLKDFMPKSMPGVAGYTRIANRMDGLRNQLLTEYQKVAEVWAKFTSKNKQEGRILGELMHASTLAEVDPSKEYSPIYPEGDSREETRKKSHKTLKKHWDALPEEAQNVYNNVRDAYGRQRDRVFEGLKERIEAADADNKTKKKLLDELRKTFEFGKKGPYFPLSRHGEYWAVARDSKGEVVSFSKFEKVSQRDDWMANFKKSGFSNVEGGTISDDKTTLKNIDPSFVAKVTSMADDIKGPEGTALADEIWQLYLRTLPEMSMRKAAIHRKGRMGYSADALRNYAQHMFHGAHQLARLKYTPQLDKELKKTEVQAKEVETSDAPDKNWAMPLYDELASAHEAAMNPNPSAMAALATSVGFAMFLGITPAAAMVNLTQTPMIALPTMGAKFGFTKSAVALLKASKDYAKSTKPLSESLTGDELAAFNEAYRIGLFEQTNAHALAGISDDGMELSQKHQRFMKVVSWTFHKAEEFNRQTTYMASYRLARKAGQSHSEAIIVAEDITWDSHFDYASVNRPRVLRGNFSKVALLFKQYSLNMTYRIGRDFKDGIIGNKQLSPEAKKEATKKFAGMMVMAGLFAGAMGMPIAWAVISILDSVLSTDDEPYDSETAFRQYLTELFGGGEQGTKLSQAIMDGPVSAFTGASISNRVSIDIKEMWLRSPHKELEGTQWWAHVLGEMAGPVLGGIPKNMLQGMSDIKEDRTERGIERMLPKFASDIMKAMRFMEEGAKTYGGTEVLPKEAFTNKALFLQAIGFSPSELALTRRQAKATQEMSAKITKRRQSLINRFFLAHRNGDKDAIAEYREQIRAFNKVHPRIAIKTSTLAKSARGKARRDARAIGGVTLPKKLHYLHEKTKFIQTDEEKDE